MVQQRTKQLKAPYMKFYPVFKFTRAIIAFAVVLGSFGFLFVLAYRAVPKDNVDTINLACGFVLGVLATVISYYFGNSKDKSDAEQAARGDASNTQPTNTP
jgi:hypothetical protein